MSDTAIVTPSDGLMHRMTIGMGNLCGAPTPPGNRATTFGYAVTCPACVELRPHADLSGELVPVPDTQAACDTITKAAQ